MNYKGTESHIPCPSAPYIYQSWLGGFNSQINIAVSATGLKSSQVNNDTNSA